MFSVIAVPPTHAAGITCKIETDPKIVTTNDSHIKTLTINANGLDESKKYLIAISGVGYESVRIKNQKFSGGKLTFSDVNGYGMPASSTGGTIDTGLLPYYVADLSPTFPAGTVTVEVIDPSWFGKLNEDRKCLTTFAVEKGTGNKCQMFFPTEKIEAGQDIKMQLTGLDPTTTYVTYLQKDSDKGKTVTSASGNVVCHTGAEYEKAEGVSLGTYENGIYFTSVYPTAKTGCDALALSLTSLATTYTANGKFGVAKACSGLIMIPGFAIGAGTPASATVSGFLAFTGTIPSPCKNGGSSTEFKYECPTAIGTINTNPTEFVKRVMGIFLGIGGGIATLLIILAGYKILTSQGQPEKIQEARETITSVVIGLLFMIFAIAILQIIGVDILRIPGFSR